MKTIKVLFILLFVLQMPAWAQQERAESSCFSAAHFDLVNQYVAQKTQLNQGTVFNYEGYEITVVNNQELQFKQNGFKEAIIVRDKGVMAMSKSAEQNREITARVEKVFCHLFAEQKKNK